MHTGVAQVVRYTVLLYGVLDLMVSVDQKLDSRIQSEAKRKEPGILNLVKQYNNLCQEIEVLMGQGYAPRGALKPTMIDREGLFKLDVDDDIWQDIGLQDGPDTASPRWLTDIRKNLLPLTSLFSGN